MQTELLRERYEPLEVVGRGGEGEVIRALDHLHGRQVALKVRRVSDEASRSHLLSEARLLLSLSPHPGLPLVREDFFVDERYVIAMDWIEGTDLQALLDAEDGRGLDPALVIGYLEQAAEALGAPPHTRPNRRARRRQAGKPDPDLLRSDRPRRLRTVLQTDGRASPGRYGRLRGRRARGRGQTDRGVGRVLAGRHRRGAAHRRAPVRRRAELGHDRAGSGSRRWSGSCARTWRSIRCAAMHRRPPSSPGCSDGGAPPSRGERSRSCWPT